MSGNGGGRVGRQWHEDGNAPRLALPKCNAPHCGTHNLGDNWLPESALQHAGTVGMSGKITDILDRLSQRRSIRAWARAAELAGNTDMTALRGLRSRAVQARRTIDKVLTVADERLTRSGHGGDGLRRPLHSDWAWRPALWSRRTFPAGIAPVESRNAFSDAQVFHDCRVSELTMRQVRNLREQDLAPFGVRLDVFHFDGSFLSLAIDLPPEAVQGLKLRHLIRLECDVEVEKPIEIFARLNVMHGPNTEQIVRELPNVPGESSVDFDLAYTKLNEKRVEKAWVDIIFEGPELNQIVLRDVTFSRRPRAEL